jgi:hypothetical protein
MAANGLGAAPNNTLSDDYDRDGYSNGDEYLFGTNPAGADSGRLIEVAATGASVTLEFLKLNQGATYILQETADLSSETWNTSPVAMTESPDQSGVGIGYTRMRAFVPASGKKFLRVRATY